MIDTIERTILIDAPIERVWDIVTAPEHMGQLVRRRRRLARRRRHHDALGGARRGRAAGRPRGAADTLRLPLGRERRRDRRHARRVHASRTEGAGTRMQRRRERLATLRTARSARPSCAKATSAAGSTSSATWSATRRPSPCDRGRLHRARGPDPAPGPRPAGGARARHGDHPRRPAAREPPCGDQAPGRPRPRRARRRAAARSRGALRRPVRAAPATAAWMARLAARGTRGSTRSARWPKSNSQITNASAPTIVNSHSPRTVTSAMNVSHRTSRSSAPLAHI